LDLNLDKNSALEKVSLTYLSLSENKIQAYLHLLDHQKLMKGEKLSSQYLKTLDILQLDILYVDKQSHQISKYLAEEYLKFSNIDWTIFRPSLIFGDPRGGDRPEFCSQIKKDMLSLPFPAPNFYPGLNPMNAGKFVMSPIHIKNVESFL
jgi:hypothetical protein